MKKIFLSVVGFSMLCRLNTQAQTRPDTAAGKPAYTLHDAPKQDTSHYASRKIHLDEIDLVSSYYSQNGNHSAVTGGIGTERVTDISNGIDLNFVWTDHRNNKNTLAVGLGFDAHTSASQAFISKTGASQTGGTRIYPSLDWTVESAKTGNTFGIGAYYSNEFNYKSLGAGLHFSAKTDNKNGEFSAKLQGYFDQVTLIFPSEFEPASNTAFGNGGDGRGHRDYGSSPRKTYTALLLIRK